MAERKEPGHSYAWYVTVAAQRIHGIRPQDLKTRRAELRLVKTHHQPAKEPETRDLDFTREIIGKLNAAGRRFEWRDPHPATI